MAHTKRSFMVAVCYSEDIGKISLILDHSDDALLVEE